jgi:hypothetical protein
MTMNKTLSMLFIAMCFLLGIVSVRAANCTQCPCKTVYYW